MIRYKEILYLSSFGNLRWGGQKSLYHLVDRLDRSRFKPYVALPTDEDFAAALRKKRVDVFILDFPRIGALPVWPQLKALFHLRRIVRENNIALLHADGPRNAFYAGMIGRWLGVPLVFHVRSSDHDRYDRLLYHLATKVILVSDVLKQRFRFARNESKFVSIYNGVNLADYRPDEISRARAGRKADPGDLLITCLGRIEPMKGQLTLVDACGRIPKGLFRFRLCLAGEIVDADYLEDCRRMADRYGIGDATIFPGHVEDVPGLLAETDVFVLPSFGEAFSRAIIEAMAMKKAVVATNVGGAAEAIVNGETGFIVLPGDAEAMAEKLCLLLGDFKLRSHMGEVARKRVETLFTIDKNVALTETLYDGIFSGR